MSVMVAVAVDGRVAMAADSLWASGWDKSQVCQPKIERRGEVLFSVGPSCGLEQVLWDEIYALIGQGGEWWRKWSAHCLGADSSSPIWRIYERDKSDCVLVGWRGRVFKVWAGGCIVEDAQGIETAGCGGDFARAAAWMLRKRSSNPLRIAEAAVGIACELSAGCEPPIVSAVLKRISL
jgi:ATP-dependent protease HslVU (ClpYQ) peptidase subunit